MGSALMGTTHIHGTYSLEAFFENSQKSLPIERLFADGKVGRDTLYAVSESIFARKLLAMIDDGHPLGAKVRENKIDMEQVLSSIGSMGVGRAISGYLSEREIFPDLKIADSNTMGHFLTEMETGSLERCFDMALLRRAVPSLVQSSMDEAKEMIQAIAKEKAAQRSAA
ncbi:MAG: hypothetical protein ACKVOE_10165 [Rickettsiales bacterium]